MALESGKLLKQLLYIAKTTKLKHIFNAIKSPDHAISVFKYHYRRVADREFAEFFARQWGCSDDDIDQAYNGLSNNAPCWKEIKENLSIYPGQYGLQMTIELPSLYLLIRLTRPDIVVETGVSSGASSAYILCAMHDNNKGRLYSIDLPPDNLPAGKSSGWLVPHRLKSRWSLHIGDSKELLEPLFNAIGKIDCFIYDSLHTYEHMMFEFRTS